MALKGSLRDFGLSEILQMIGHQNKSGQLTVKTKGSEVKILFDSGGIVSTSAKPMPPDLEWREFLVRSRLIAPAEFDLAEKKSKESLQPLEVTLLKYKALSESELKEVIRLRNLEIINSLFLLNEGEYEFESGSVSYIEQLTVPINSEQVLMDGYRIKDEWPGISKEVPSLEMRFVKKPGEFTESDRLPDDENRIYRMVSQDCTVRDLISMSRAGKFETCRILARLVEKERILPLGDVSPVSVLRAPSRNRVIQLFFYPAVLVLVLLLINGVRINLDREYSYRTRRSMEEKHQLRRIEQALETYNLINGSYPDRLDVLVSGGFLRLTELSFPWQENYNYERTGEGYVLKSPAGKGRRP